MKLYLTIILFLSFTATAQIINFQDPVFKQMLLDHGSTITGNGISTIDTNGDQEIQVSEANFYTGSIYLDDTNSGQLQNLTGMSNFSNIAGFTLKNASIDSLYLNSSVVLDALVLENVQNLSFFDFSEIPYIKFVDVQFDLGTATAYFLVYPLSGNIDSIYIDNSNISSITAYDIPLKRLTIKNCQQLMYIDVAYSNLTYFYPENCPNLQGIFLENSQDLSSLRIENVTSPNLNTLLCHNTPNLNCIEVQDINLANSQTGWSKDAGDSYSTDCLANPCVVYFSDLNLKNRILEHGYSIVGNGIGIIDLNDDDSISCYEAFAYQGLIDLSNTLVDSNLVGLEYFVNINSLNLSSNDFDALYLPNTFNNIENLDLSDNNMVSLGFQNQNAISNYSNLRYLDISFNMLNQNLNFLNGLDTLYANDNNLVEMDLAGNFNLKSLNLSNNNLEELSLVIGTNYNQLLDVNLLNNPTLFCVDVDDSIFSDVNWVQKDIQTKYSEDCSGTVFTTSINNEDQPLNLSVYPNPATDFITISNMLDAGIITLFNSTGKLVFRTTQSEIDISSLEKGIYFIIIENEVNSVKRKLIIQ
jgi:hypothetical protein